MSTKSWRIGLQSLGMGLVPLGPYNLWNQYRQGDQLESVYIEILRQKEHYENKGLIKNIELDN